ncbi:hypothetical protein [Hansschlegelia zhihuaiae]|uniref:Uncharacterized protein n=1 Tax=Hansschlegelia zhihuaiae TaxID=405005 RepID=A0A4Q0M6Z1_9HYPH|nr:hypothetical protein [Hansschlegelia zhihuaiae]RXF68456.1 hypothetical protein EK403_19905 [Hansschlegelia zhihuaiae]
MRALGLLAAAAAIGGAAIVSSAWAEPPPADRYELKQVDGGFLRLDRQTGMTSLCAPAGDGYACRPTAEGGSADAAMVAQLEKRVAELEARVKALSPDRSASLKGAVPRDPTLDLPTDEQVDRVASFLERATRRFKKLATEMQREADGGSL